MNWSVNLPWPGRQVDKTDSLIVKNVKGEAKVLDPVSNGAPHSNILHFRVRVIEAL